jgi:hypothetical protein
MKVLGKLNNVFGCSGFHIPINKQTIRLMDKKEKFIKDLKRVQLLLNKTNTFDFFMDIEQKNSGEGYMYDVEHIIKYKVEKCLCEGILLNIKLIMSMNCVKHILYVKVALKRIELARQIFIYDI